MMEWNVDLNKEWTENDKNGTGHYKSGLEWDLNIAMYIKGWGKNGLI